MDVIYYLSGFAITVTILGGIAGVFRPSWLQKLLGKYATRKNILIFGIVGFFVFGTILSATEPESVKQDRLEREKSARITKQHEEEARLATEAKAAQIAEQKPIAPQEENNSQNPRYYWHRVTGIVDGDTIKAIVSGKEEVIRIIGIDAPEATSVDECYGPESTAKAKEFLGGKWIQLEADPSQADRDKYGRLLRFVWFDSGTDFGRRMIEEGYAYEYTYEKAYIYQSLYKSTQQVAENSQQGLWGPNTCQGRRVKPQPASTNTQQNNTTQNPSPTPTPTQTQTTATQTATPAETSTYYKNCTEARNAGVAPIYEGDPGYRSALDRDRDGVACE